MTIHAATLLSHTLFYTVASAANSQPPETTEEATAPASEDVAEPALTEPAPAEPAEPAEPADVAGLRAEVEGLRREVATLREQDTYLQEDIDAVRQEEMKRPPPGNLRLMDNVNLRFGGYLDFGYFWAMGDGVAYVPRLGTPQAPLPEGVAWVFDGDPWANPINAQGDSADLGLDRTNIDRFDPIASGGRPSFIVNMVNLSLVANVGKKLLFETSINFEPRQGDLGRHGDVFNVDLAYLEWKPFEKADISFFAGKFESTFGIEYRRRKAPALASVTPSIISRYTTGNPTGLKMRGSVGKGIFVYNVALTNGGMFTERFGHLFDELDTNGVPTGSARVAFVMPVKFGFELGASGVYGSQDRQRDHRITHWQAGADIALEAKGFALRGEFLKSRTDRQEDGQTPSLDSMGFYTTAAYRILPWLMPVVRVDWRRATLVTPPNMYVSNTGRLTAGLRFDISFNVILKAEYMHIQEFQGPEIKDDVVTSSLVFHF